MENTDDDWKDSPLSAGIMFLILLASPLGAPVLLLVAGMTVDLEWLAQFIPEAIEAYIFGATFGPFFFVGMFGLLWWLLSIVAVIRFGWIFICSFWTRSHAIW